MSATLRPDCKTTTAIGQLLLVPQIGLMEVEAGKVQETIWQLQDEVRMLREELARTRRSLDQRDLLLRNAHQREIELRAEVGAGRR